MRVRKDLTSNNTMLKLICILVISANQFLNAQSNNIKNDQFWNTIDGKPIYSQGGGIFKFNDPKDGVEKYYWYGAFYKEAELYRKDPSVTQITDNFVAVTCYTSTDLVNWSFENNVLDRKEVNKHADDTRWMGRLGVAFIKEINQYAMFIQHNVGVLIAVSDTPTGPFKWHQRLDMTETIGTPNTGDQTVFTDEDTGKSYLVYSYGRGRHKIYVSEIGIKNGKVDLIDCTQVYRGTGREGNCMFKLNGKYYIFASNLYGWDASLAYYLVADDIRGPYLPTNEMLVTEGASEDYAHITQTGFFVKVNGTEKETVVYCGDRWSNFAGNGLGYNQWIPLSFEGDVPYFNSLNSWNLNEKTGTWQVAKDNDFVKNGSFEADRKAIPSPVKPVQTELTGWTTNVLKGNKIKNDKHSPVLNYFNTEYDRKTVIGEKSLNISDMVDFKRKVTQTISSSPYVELSDGEYTLTAKVKNSKGFKSLEMYALSSCEKNSYQIEQENATWKTISINNIVVKDGKVEIGFMADGVAKANCQIDDVSFVKNNN
ncbi:family 43 glycosylhydrolase [Mariniflexile sp. HNIBRBA6329]|uniref:family 43 glycosylhydrolase n=1 Tax=Mariniflexile sp. HNIBRBA6329 TaxID=3373088 RepID=UPI00374612E0